VRLDPPGDPVHHPCACAARRYARVLEERDVRARVAALVRVEEVVHGRVVLVDGLLDQSQSEHARVEVEVARRVAGDAGDVMDTVEVHRGHYGRSYSTSARKRRVRSCLGAEKNSSGGASSMIRPSSIIRIELATWWAKRSS